jgi:hypothetical protein
VAARVAAAEAAAARAAAADRDNRFSRLNGAKANAFAPFCFAPAL